MCNAKKMIGVVFREHYQVVLSSSCHVIGSGVREKTPEVPVESDPKRELFINDGPLTVTHCHVLCVIKTAGRRQLCFVDADF